MWYFAGLFGGSPLFLRHAVRFRLSSCWLLWFSLLPAGRRRWPVCAAVGGRWLASVGGLRRWLRCCHPLRRAVCAGVRRRFAAACRVGCSFVRVGVGGCCWRWCAGGVSGCWAGLPAGCSPWLRLLWWRVRFLGLCRSGCPVGRGGVGLVGFAASCLAGFGRAFARAGLVVSPGCCSHAVAVRVGFGWRLSPLAPFGLLRPGLFYCTGFQRVIHIFWLVFVQKKLHKCCTICAHCVSLCIFV